MNGIELDFFSDIEMHFFIEKGMRGSIFKLLKDIVKQIISICKIMIIVNQVHLFHSKPRTFISCLDANNLFDWATSKYFPYGGFKWLSQKEINEFDVYSVAENSSIGWLYIKS